ncbi:MAG: zinc ribbon domain-containing protein [Chloroflexi bacterium]|nr:zinc ribbon domain-containing protein [Chloroflexota bacterium]
MRKRFLALILAALLGLPSPAWGQGAAKIESVTVSLWPEYDKPNMLVIHYILLSSETQLPARVDIRIAADAALHTVAVGATAETVSDQGVDYQVKIESGWQVVSINADGPAIQLEYYDPNLKKEGERRSYSFGWLSDYDVANFGVLFQQPFDASQFSASLPLREDGVHSDKLQYYFSEVGAVPAGEALTFTLSYVKPTDALSVSRLQFQPVEVDESAAGRVSLNNYLPYLIGALGVLLIVGGLLYYRQPGHAASKKTRRRHTEREDGGSGLYCSQCGARARSGDRFCRTCGSRLRQAEE